MNKKIKSKRTTKRNNFRLVGKNNGSITKRIGVSEEDLEEIKLTPPE